MIEEKIAFINDIDDKSFINDECNKELHYFRCPKCGSYHVVRNGTYTRKTSLLNGDSAYIKVQKCLCRDCGISFKILPMCISGLNHLSLISLCFIGGGLVWLYMLLNAKEKSNKTSDDPLGDILNDYE